MGKQVYAGLKGCPVGSGQNRLNGRFSMDNHQLSTERTTFLGKRCDQEWRDVGKFDPNNEFV